MNIGTKKHFIVIMLICFFIVAAGCQMGSDEKKLEPEQAAQWLKDFIGNSGNNNRPIVLGYYENPWQGKGEATGSLPSMRSFASNMTGISPYWYRLTIDGSLESTEKEAVYQEAKSLGLKVYPLVTNKRDATEKLLGDAETRKTAVKSVVELIKEKNYDGVDIDFELLPPEQRENLTLFMMELYPKMQEIGKTVIISVFPQVDVHESVSGAYDYENLAKWTDYIQIMTYDHHWSTSEPGAIAPVDWYNENIAYAVKACGAGKILVGMGAYGYNWNTESGQAETITYPDAMVLAKQKNVVVEYDEAAQSPHFSYDGGEVWFENARSAAAKLEIIKKYQPAGVAVWRLGQEQPELWQEISKVYPR